MKSSKKSFKVFGIVLVAHLFLGACQANQQAEKSMSTVSRKVTAGNGQLAKSHIVVAEIHEDGYVLVHGNHYHVDKGKIPYDAKFLKDTLAPDDYKLQKSDIIASLEKGYIVKVGSYFYYYPKDKARQGNVVTLTEARKLSRNLKLDGHHKSSSSSDQAKGVAGIDRPTSDGFLLKDEKQITARTETGIIVDHNGHSHFLFYADLKGSKWAYLIPETYREAPGHRSSATATSRTSQATDDHYVFDTKDIVAEDAKGYTVRHGDHYHYILKSSLDHQPVRWQEEGRQTSSEGSGTLQVASPVGSRPGIDQPTSDGFLFDGTGVVGWTELGLMVDHGGHLHLLPKADIANSKWSYLLESASQQPATSSTSSSQTSQSAVSRPSVDSSVDEIALKRAYLARATGLTEQEIVLFNSPDGTAFMYPHGDHRHVVLLSNLDISKPFNDGHGNQSKPSPDTRKPSTQAGTGGQQATPPVQPQAQPQPTLPTQPQPAQPTAPSADEVAVKRAYLAKAVGVAEADISLVNTPDGPAFTYPHGNHSHLILLSQIDVTKPFDDGHSQDGDAQSHDHQDQGTRDSQGDAQGHDHQDSGTGDSQGDAQGHDHQDSGAGDSQADAEGHDHQDSGTGDSQGDAEDHDHQDSGAGDSQDDVQDEPTVPLPVVPVTPEEPSVPTPPVVEAEDEVAVKRAYLARETGLREDQIILLPTPTGPAFMYPHGNHNHLVLLSQIDVTKPFDDGHGSDHGTKPPSVQAPTPPVEPQNPTPPANNPVKDNPNHQPSGPGQSNPAELSPELAEKRAYLATSLALPVESITVLETPTGPAFRYPHGNHDHIIPASEIDLSKKVRNPEEIEAKKAYIAKVYGVPLEAIRVTDHLFVFNDPGHEYDPTHIHPYAISIDKLHIPVVTGVPEIDFENELLALAERTGLPVKDIKVVNGKFAIPHGDHDHYVKILSTGEKDYYNNKLPAIKAGFRAGGFSKERVLAEVERLLAQAKVAHGETSVAYRRVARALEEFTADLATATTSTEAYLDALRSFDNRYIKGLSDDGASNQPEVDNYVARYTNLTDQLKGFDERTLKNYSLNPEQIIAKLQGFVTAKDDLGLSQVETHFKAIVRAKQASSDLAPRLAYMDFFLRNLDSDKLPANLRDEVIAKLNELYKISSLSRNPQKFREGLASTAVLKEKVKAALAAEQAAPDNASNKPYPMGFYRKDMAAYVNSMRDFVLRHKEITAEELSEGFTKKLPLFPGKKLRR